MAAHDIFPAPTIFVSDPAAGERRLQEVFGATADEFRQIVRAAHAAKNDSVPHDPKSAGGQLAYIFGTRASRDVFVPKGWLLESTDNIESVFHPASNTRLIYQNTDSAADRLRDPKAISRKGPAAARMLDLAPPYLFPDMEKERLEKAAKAKRRENETVWFLCAAIENSETVRAEVSRPRRVENNQFKSFIERIPIITGNGPSPASRSNETDGGGQEFEVSVTRK